MTDSLGLPTGGFTTTNVTPALIEKQNSGLGTVTVTAKPDTEGATATYLEVKNAKSTVYVVMATGAVSDTVPTT